MLNEITFAEVANFIQGDLAILEVTSNGCRYCKMMEPHLASVAEDGYKIAKINASDNREIADAYNVSGAPTVLYFKDGELFTRTAGFKRRSEILQVIDDVEKGVE